jgi:probable poly-beta-1,6-N-acetyl-D-glucosamine export protein
MIKEWNLLRTLACLSIVFLHSTTYTGRHLGYLDWEYYRLFRIALCYATPTFIVLSEIILANRYPDKLPNNFWSKRIKWIFAPYLAFAIIDAFVSKYFSPNMDLGDELINNIFIGNYEGYFVLIIFQFYLLHYLVTKFKISMLILLPISIVIMFWHLNILNQDIAFIQENRHITMKLPFTAWFAYFTVAFVIGKHYKRVANVLYRVRWLTIFGVLITAAFLYLSFESGNIAVNSRRMDLFPLVISISLAVLAWGQIIPSLKIVNLISNYSFGIYLVHWQVQRFVAPYTADIFQSTATHVFALLFISLTISITFIKLVSYLPIGSFIVGNIKRKVYKNKAQQAGVKAA